MINDNLKLETLYINRRSGQQTYFFIKENNKLFGIRKDRRTNWKWNFGIWSDYSNPNNTDDIGELEHSELIKLRRLAVDDLFLKSAHNLGV